MLTLAIALASLVLGFGPAASPRAHEPGHAVTRPGATLRHVRTNPVLAFLLAVAGASYTAHERAGTIDLVPPHRSP